MREVLIKIDDIRKEIGIREEFVPQKLGILERPPEEDEYYIKAAFDDRDNLQSYENTDNPSYVKGQQRRGENSVGRSLEGKDNYLKDSLDGSKPQIHNYSSSRSPGESVSHKHEGMASQSPDNSKVNQNEPNEAANLKSPVGEFREGSDMRGKSKSSVQELDRIEEKSENSVPLERKKSKQDSVMNEPKHERSKSDNNQVSNVVSVKELLSGDKSLKDAGEEPSKNISVMLPQKLDDGVTPNNRSRQESEDLRLDSKVSASPTSRTNRNSVSNMDKSLTKKKKKPRSTQKLDINSLDIQKPDPAGEPDKPIEIVLSKQESLMEDDLDGREELVKNFTRRQYLAIVNQIEIEEEFEELESDLDKPFEYDPFDDDNQRRRNSNISEESRDRIVKDEDLEDILEESPNDIYAHFRLGELEIEKEEFSERLKYHFTKVHMLDDRYKKHVVDQALGSII